jgi:hypothetical protein
LGVAKLVFPNDERMCLDWLAGYSLSTAMLSTTAIVVEIVNEVIVGILMCKVSFHDKYLGSSEFQRFRNKTEEKLSKIPKILMFEFINTVVILILINANVPEL